MVQLTGQKCLALAGGMFISFAMSGGRLAKSQEPLFQAATSHGTVNILLADQNGLVAVADSMLTYSDNSHSKGGNKLFKLDGRTICMMAGQYSLGEQSGPLSLALFVPAVMNRFSAQLANDPSPISFELKAERLSRSFEHQVTASLQALATDSVDRSMVQPLYLTLAGYDLDGSLKVAELAFAPSEDSSGAYAVPTMRAKRSGMTAFLPGIIRSRGVTFRSPYEVWMPGEPLLACEISIGLEPQSLGVSPSPIRIRKMGRPMFCEAVGINGVAERLLMEPEKHVSSPAVSKYAAALLAHRQLTLNEMRDFALEMELRTETEETKQGSELVGGAAAFAVLEKGAITALLSNPSADPVLPETGVALTATQVRNTTFETDCQNIGTAMKNGTPNMIVPAQIHTRHCIQPLDGFNFHNSSFIESELYFFGEGMFEFSSANVITDSSLTLGPSVDVTSPRVKHLICDFDWKAVNTDGKLTLPMCGKKVK